MAQTWLPGDTRQRIQDLIKDSSITQAELAGIIGLSESALSRYLKGQTEMLGDGYIIKIAKHFNVSTFPLFPNSLMLPPLRTRCPQISFSVVDLPEPFSPMKP